MCVGHDIFLYNFDWKCFLALISIQRGTLEMCAEDHVTLHIKCLLLFVLTKICVTKYSGTS